MMLIGHNLKGAGLKCQHLFACQHLFIHKKLVIPTFVSFAVQLLKWIVMFLIDGLNAKKYVN